ncbi:hypothetical protein CHARACLAT_021978, partial [Characodon lateralis]|nr:hypothetical protein [Characodon lateralis]
TELKEEDRPSCDSPAQHIENDLNSLEDMQHLNKSCNKTPKSKKTKVRKGRNNGMPQVACQPRLVSPSTRSFSIPIVLPLTSELRSPSPEVMNTSPLPKLDTLRTASPHVDFSLSGSTDGLSSHERVKLQVVLTTPVSQPIHLLFACIIVLDQTNDSGVFCKLEELGPIHSSTTQSNNDRFGNSPIPSRSGLSGLGGVQEASSSDV